MTSLVLFGIFLVLLLINIPIAISIIVATLATMLLTIDTLPALTTLAQRLAVGVDSFALLAIPFFVLPRCVFCPDVYLPRSQPPQANPG